MYDYETRYAEYQISLRNNTNFLNSFKEKHNNIHDALLNIMQRSSYQFGCTALYVLGGVLVGIFVSVFPDPIDGNVVGNIIRIVTILGFCACFFFAHRLSCKNEKLVSYAVFESYIYREMIKKRVSDDKRFATYEIADQMSNIWDRIEWEARKLSTEKDTMSQQELNAYLESICQFIFRLDEKKKQHSQISKEYDKISSDIVNDYFLYCDIRRHIQN